jgi:hypothetical protein
LRFSFLVIAANFSGTKTKSPLHGEAVSGLEIRFKGLLNDSDRTPAQAVAGTTTRGLGAAIHERKSYMDMDACAKGKFRGSGGAI